MLGLYSAHASSFLVVAAVFAFVLGGPMLITPIGWARVLRWHIPTHTDLAVYFGRCLGGVVTVMAVFAIVAAGKPEVQPFYFTFVMSAVGLNILIHAYGAVKGIQPLSETIEIAAWAALFVCCLLFYPA